tara:strand:+ start:235 stop:438 length:204 start_codon:yes stop_codon:yes gene_type:complete
MVKYAVKKDADGKISGVRTGKFNSERGWKEATGTPPPLDAKYTQPTKTRLKLRDVASDTTKEYEVVR